jgi:hypothetical protein
MPLFLLLLFALLLLLLLLLLEKLWLFFEELPPYTPLLCLLDFLFLNAGEVELKDRRPLAGGKDVVD